MSAVSKSDRLAGRTELTRGAIGADIAQNGTVSKSGINSE